VIVVFWGGWTVVDVIFVVLSVLLTVNIPSSSSLLTSPDPLPS
jgi:hypothetical protein